MKKIQLIILALLFLGSCKNMDFGDINKDPIGPNEPSPKDLLAGGMMNFFNNAGRSYHTNPTFYVQWQTQNQYTSEMRYADQPIDWDPWYVQVLSNFKTNIDYIDSHRSDATVLSMGDPDNQIAVNKIMMAYVFKFLTDIYGDIPFSEALDPNNKTPKYDNQLEVYHGIIDMLKEARDMINTSAPVSVKGDILYNGDMSKWQKLANSLIIDAALQLSNVASEVNYAKGEYASALSHSAGVIEAVSDEAWVYYDHNSTRLQNPWSRLRPEDYFLSKEFTDALQGEDQANNITSCSATYNHTPDAREQIFSNSPGDDGHAYSCSNTGGGTKMSTLIWNPDAPLPFYTAAWTYLDRAEGAARGWSTENYDDMLTNAINASYASLSAHYGVDITGSAAAYAAARVADANDANYGGGGDPKLRVVGEEKWVAYFPMGFQEWAQWRRIGYPELVPHPNAINATGQIPRRYAYPSTEHTFNPDGYQSGVSDLTPAEDRNDSRIPWDQ